MLLRECRNPGSAANARRWLSDRRLPFALDKISFAVAGPGRHRRGDDVERLRAIVAELELRAGRDRDRDARYQIGHVFPVADLAPDPAAAADNAPELLDCAVRDRPGDGIREQREHRDRAA